jgi:spore coat protein U-like protein
MKLLRHALGLCLLLGWAQLGFAACTTISHEGVDLGEYPSISFSDAGLGTTETSSGLNCSGLAVGIATTSYIRYAVTHLDARLINPSNGDVLNISFRDQDALPISAGSERTAVSTKLLSLFNTTTGDLPFYATIAAGQQVSPGTYISVSPIQIRWYYAIPTFGASCLLATYSKSPGLTMNTFSCGVANWGDGIASQISYRLTLLPDCRIVANPINFGSAPFASHFEPVYSSLGVRCSSKTPYSVGLDQGQHYYQQQRNMQNGSNRLAYEIYKQSDQQVWGNQGTQRWSSAEASSNAGIYDGKTQQSYSLRAEIASNNSEHLAPGDYTDTITVDISF